MGVLTLLLGVVTILQIIILMKIKTMQLSQVVGYVKDIIIPAVYAQDWAPDGTQGDANALIKQILNLILIVVVVAAVVFIMFAGLQYVTSLGDATKAKNAMSGITNAIIGLIVAFAAYALVQLVMSQLNLGGGTIKPLPTA
jgi:hypothetical protein